jgi:uncharacterized cupredoxin-like copper-binding protein
MRSLTRLLPLAALLGSAAGAAAAQQPHAAPSRATVPVVTVTARDYAFDAPDTLAAGLTTLRLVNRGPELHHVQLLRLDGGRTLADLMAAFKAGGAPPTWSHDVGGPNAPVPGGQSEATVELKPGRYVIACFIPSPKGPPHIAKGMARELIVAPAARTAAAARAASPQAVLTLTDYRFDFSRPLTAGRQLVRVRNTAQQSHEVLFVRLAPGKSAHDFVAWAEQMAGPPPGQPVGGTTAIERGGWNDVSLDLAPGDYALICFIPDARDGKPHLAHGMVRQLRVEGARRTASR